MAHQASCTTHTVTSSEAILSRGRLGEVTYLRMASAAPAILTDGSKLKDDDDDDGNDGVVMGISSFASDSRRIWYRCMRVCMNVCVYVCA